MVTQPLLGMGAILRPALKGLMGHFMDAGKGWRVGWGWAEEGKKERYFCI